MRFLTLSLLAYITGSTFCEVLEISLGVTTLSKVTSFLEETNFSELTVLLVVIVFLTEFAYIEVASIGSTCIGDDFIRVVSIEVAASASVRGAGIGNTD